MKYYVYLHRRNDTNEIFYVGKGTGDRVYDWRRRTEDWFSAVSNHGYTAEVLKDGLSEEDAYDLEGLIIDTLGLDNLTNRKSGHGYNMRRKLREERRLRIEAINKERSDRRAAKKLLKQEIIRLHIEGTKQAEITKMVLSSKSKVGRIVSEYKKTLSLRTVERYIAEYKKTTL